MRVILKTILVLCLCQSLACDKHNTEPLNPWQKDLIQFKSDLKRYHLNPFTKLSEESFDNEVDALYELSSNNNLDDIELIVGLARIMALIGDSHSTLIHGYSRFPFGVIWLTDGLYINSIDKVFSSSLGKRIKSIEGLEIEAVIDSFRTIIPYENESNFKYRFENMIRYIEFHSYLNRNFDNDELTIGFEDGSEIILDSQFQTYEKIQTDTIPLYLQNSYDRYTFIKLPEDQIIYVQYNTCQNWNPPFDEFTNEIMSSYRSDPNYKKIVLDLRLNGGGNSLIAQPLIDSLSSLVEANRISKDNIFVVIGKRTYSSAVLNALQIDASINPVFVGEPSGGKPNHFGEVRSFDLKNSELKISYSTKYFEYLNDDPDSFYPDVQIEYNSTHFLNGIDPVMEWIKSQ